MGTRPGQIYFGGLLALGLAAEAAAHPGWGIVERQGQIYFGDVQTNTVWKHDREHGLRAIASGKHSHSLFMDEAGNLMGEDVDYDSAGQRWIHGLWQLTLDGRLVDPVPETSGPPQGARGDAGSAQGRDGSLYVTDAGCVRRITMDGNVTTVGGNPLAGVPRSEHPRLLGIAVDSSDNVYVADYDYRCIRRITPNGDVETPLMEGFYWSPSGVTVVGDDLYVLEHQPESPVGVLAALNVGPYIRVRKLSPSGSVTTIATVWGKNTTPASAVVFGVGALLGVWAWRSKGRRRAARSPCADSVEPIRP